MFLQLCESFVAVWVFGMHEIEWFNMRFVSSEVVKIAQRLFEHSSHPLSVTSNDGDDEAVQVDQEWDQVKRDFEQVSMHVWPEINLRVHLDRIIDAQIDIWDGGVTVDQPYGHGQVEQHDEPATGKCKQNEHCQRPQNLRNDPLSLKNKHHC